MNFIHRWLNPHCTHCIEAARESRICDSCETLKLEIARLRQDNERLLDRLLKEPELPKVQIEQDLRPINPSRFMSWNMRREMLERESRDAALKLQEKMKSNKLQPTNSPVNINKSVEELERELGVEDATEEARNSEKV